MPLHIFLTPQMTAFLFGEYVHSCVSVTRSHFSSNFDCGPMLYNMFSSGLQTPIFLADNIGAYRDLVHADTTTDVSMHFPASVGSLNPWAYITATS